MGPVLGGPQVVPGLSHTCVAVAAGAPLEQPPRFLLAGSVLAAPPGTALGETAAVEQDTDGDEQGRGHHGHHEQGRDRLLLLIGCHHGQQVSVLTACPHVPRVTHAGGFVLLHQEAAGAVEAELAVGVGTLIEV